MVVSARRTSGAQNDDIWDFDSFKIGVTESLDEASANGANTQISIFVERATKEVRGAGQERHVIARALQFKKKEIRETTREKPVRLIDGMK